MSGGWAALDPGRQKCGLVRTDASGAELVDLLICSPREAWDWLQHWQHQAPLQGVVLGDGTASGPWQQALAELEPAVPVVLQPEAGSLLKRAPRWASSNTMAAKSSTGLGGNRRPRGNNRCQPRAGNNCQ